MAQIAVGANGIRSGTTVIDAGRVHTATADIGSHGVRTHGSTLGGTTIRGNGQTRTIDCGGSALTLDGNANHLTLSGCSTILVNGNMNEIAARFGRPGRLSIMGNRNRIGWHAAPRTHVAVSDLGNRNVVTAH